MVVVGGLGGGSGGGGYPAYSSDLAPSDYFWFLQLKKHLKGNHYDSDEEVVAAVRQWCREQSPEFFADGIRQLV